MFRRLLGALAVVALAASGAGAWGWHRFTSSPAGDAHDERIVTIPKGATARKAATLLADQGVVRSAPLFERYLRVVGASGRLRAGEFRFYTDWTPERVKDALLHDPEVTRPLTIPEGLDFKAVAARVEAAGLGSATRFLDLCRDPVLLKKAGTSLDTLEGFLFPETYRFPRGTTERQVVEAMLAESARHWTSADGARAEQLRLTRDQVVTLASIIEKETAVPAERPLVSSVFHNRLERGMKLESDPTIIYGLADYRGDIRWKDIRDPHPWNTYVVPGLPKGPIASPGAGAIAAALHPAESRYLYFVATEGGRHHFSESYEEHARMVKVWQSRRRPLPAVAGAAPGGGAGGR